MIPEKKSNSGKATIYSFGEFQFETENLLLQRNSEVVPLAPKTLEVLLTLVEANGKLITKTEILEKVWANTFVEEANLTHHISALRKALGEDKNGKKFVETIPRRGYRFIVPVTEIYRQTNAVGAAETTISERITARFIEEIEQSGEDLPPPQSNSSRNRRQARNKFWALTAAGILLLIGGGMTIFYFAAAHAANNFSRRRTEPINYTRVNDGKNVAATTISPDGKFVAYIQNYNTEGGGTLFLRQLETNREMRLLEPDERTFGNIDFSPDGSLIYYVSFEKNSKIGAIYSISILGGAPKRLFNLDWASAFFAVSPDGKQIAFYRSDEKSQTTSLIVAASDGASESERIYHTHPSSEPSFWGFIAWSPDGRFLAVSRVSTSETQADSKLFRLDLQTGETAELSNETFISVGKMCFKSDGSELYFVGTKDNVKQKIYALDLASRQVRQVVNDEISYGNYGLGITADGTALTADLFESKADLWSVAASGDLSDARRIKRGEFDGKRGIAGLFDGSLAYISRIGDKFDIWTIKADGSDPQMLTNDAFQEKDLTTSRDGRFLVFSTDRRAADDKSGSRHLYRMNPDGSDLRQLTFGETIDTQPDCSPDGTSIVYLSASAENSVIKKVSVEGGTPIKLTDYSAVNPTFSPDGSRIAVKFMSSSRSMSGEIAIIAATGGKPEKTFPVTQFEFSTFVIPIRWTPDGAGIIFRREVDGVGNLWLQDVRSSAAPRQLTDFTSDTIFNFNYSPDGKRLLLSRGLYQNNAVVIRNF